MKKLITFIVFIFSVFVINSQTNKNYEIGVLGGINFSKLKNENFSTSTDANQLVGYNFGIQGEYYLSSSLGIKVRLLAIQKGDKRSDFDGVIFSLSSFNYNLEYFTIPIMLSWHYSDKGWYLDFGPYVGFLLSAKEEMNRIDAKDFFNDNEFGFSVGFGRGIALNEKIKLIAEIRSQVGITDISKSDSTNLSNLSLGFNIGVIHSF
ncbi:MAG: outer membrane beta-barrel protein [Bacteroidetes bacterium]|jgi:opacity protein-like surface antigen|nr:outer membrane beta-barrel protein [Bacteroidota bacterium]